MLVYWLPYFSAFMLKVQYPALATCRCLKCWSASRWCGSGSCFSLRCGSGSYLSLWSRSGSYLSVWPSKASTFSLWCGSGSCFSLWCGFRSSFPLWCESGSSFPLWCGSESRSSFPKLCGSGSATLAHRNIALLWKTVPLIFFSVSVKNRTVLQNYGSGSVRIRISRTDLHPDTSFWPSAGSNLNFLRIFLRIGILFGKFLA